MHRSAPANSAPTQSNFRGMRRLEARRQMEESNYLASRAKSKNLNPPVDLRMLDYVSVFDENLMCPICRCPFVDPILLAECDHCFCRDCIAQTWQPTAYSQLGLKGDCPSCRTPTELGPRNATSKILNNLVEDLMVKCPKSEEGCKSVLKRGEAQDHVSIYCGFALAECPMEDCELPLLRKDVGKGCLHYGVSCLDCREEMLKANLETHWRSKCPDRKVSCEMCKQQVFYREMGLHSKEECSATSVPCPGKELGCRHRSKRSAAEAHVNKCAFAKMAPLWLQMRQTMAEQETAQKAMVKKLEVLEHGFQNMQDIMSQKTEDSDRIDADERTVPDEQNARNEPEPRRRNASIASADSTNTSITAAALEFPEPPNRSRPASDATFRTAMSQRASLPLSRYAPETPRVAEVPEEYTSDFDLASPFPPPANDGPYASPLHHMLSMHENLRDEVGRISSALQELDGRHSMQNLNENLRTREEISYLGAQVAGLSRQVHWLTSAQLQRQSRTGTPSAAGPSGSASDIGGAGAGVEAAVNGAATALRGAARLVDVPSSPGSRRGRSEEGRTKL